MSAIPDEGWPFFNWPVLQLGGGVAVVDGSYLAHPHDLGWFHECPAGGGWGWIDVSSGERHRISAGSIDAEDVTIEGSLLCVGCRKHGFVRDGKWVAA